MEVVSARAGVTPDGEPCVTVTVTGGDPRHLLKRVLARLDGRAITVAHDVGCEDTREAIAVFLESRELPTAAAMVRAGEYEKESR